MSRTAVSSLADLYIRTQAPWSPMSADGRHTPEKIDVRKVSNGWIVKCDGYTYIADTYRDVLDVIDNLLRPNGPADSTPATPETQA